MTLEWNSIVGDILHSFPDQCFYSWARLGLDAAPRFIYNLKRAKTRNRHAIWSLASRRASAVQAGSDLWRHYSWHVTYALLHVVQIVMTPLLTVVFVLLGWTAYVITLQPSTILIYTGKRGSRNKTFKETEDKMSTFNLFLGLTLKEKYTNGSK